MCTTFNHAIVRRPAASMINGLTGSPELGTPDYQLALEQHARYVEALEACGLEVEVLPALEEFPDSCFVEDVAVICGDGVVLTRPADPSRAGEVAYIEDALAAHFDAAHTQRVEGPATLEGGDVMLAGGTFFVGQSHRTNADGLEQFGEAVNAWGFAAQGVPVSGYLHLKTGITYLGNNKLLVTSEFADAPELASFERILVPNDEDYAVNTISANGRVIMAEGYPVTRGLIEGAGFTDIIEVPMTEFRKIDGGLTCLSLRFTV